MSRSIILTIGLLLLAGAAQSSQAAPASQEAVEIIALINVYRIENDLSPLNINAALSAAAQVQADYQASINSLTHNGAGGSSATDRAIAAGYGAGANPFISEIIYAGSNASPQRALDWWKTSPIHNPIMLSLVRHEIGAAVASSNGQTYYTVVLGNVPGQTTALPPDAQTGPQITTVPANDRISVATPAQDGSILHLVQAGETLEEIATAYGISAAAVQALNNLQDGEALPVALIIQQSLSLNENGTEVKNPTAVPSTATPSPDAGVLASQTAGASDVDTGGTGEPQSSTAAGDTDSFLESRTALLTLMGLSAALFASLVLNAWLFRSRERLLNQVDPERQSRRRGKISPEMFAKLSRDDQRDDLLDLAKKALKDYPLDPVDIAPLDYQLNASFQVNAQRNDRQNDQPQQYCLRVSAPNYQSQDNIRSEMVYLQYIHENSDLKVPKPLATSAGELLTAVDSPRVPERRNVIMLHWQAGESLTDDELGSAEVQKVGAFMAKIHNLAEAFEEPDHFVRKRWDVDGLMGENLDVPVDRARAALNAEQLVVINAAFQRVEKAADIVGEGRDAFGLIHGDLHQKNYIFSNGEVGAIDFDTLGWGYYVYDIAVTFSGLLHRKDLGTLREAFLKGYRGERSLPPLHEQQIVPFVAARLATSTLWLAGHKHDMIFKDVAPKQIDHQINHLQAFLQR